MTKDLLEIGKKHLLTIIVAAAGIIWAYVQDGVIRDLNDHIDQRIENKVQDSKLIKTMLESEQVKEFTEEAGQSIRDNIIEEVTAKDSNKINQNAYLGKELGIRDEAVTPLLKDMLKDYKEGNLATTDELKQATGFTRRTNRVEL